MTCAIHFRLVVEHHGTHISVGLNNQGPVSEIFRSMLILSIENTMVAKVICELKVHFSS